MHSTVKLENTPPSGMLGLLVNAFGVLACTNPDLPAHIEASDHHCPSP